MPELGPVAGRGTGGEDGGAAAAEHQHEGAEELGGEPLRGGGYRIGHERSLGRVVYDGR